jgi:hypothetical protein
LESAAGEFIRWREAGAVTEASMESGRGGKLPAKLLGEAVDLLLEMIEDGRQRLEQAGSTSEWVKLAGALGQAETRLAQLLAAQAKLGGQASEFEQAFMRAIREWHESNTPVVASGKTAAQLAAQRLEKSAGRGGQSR